MRTSVLSRSVIAVASLAIASLALAAPATAATSGITRAQVLEAADAIRDGQSQVARSLALSVCDYAEGDGLDDLQSPRAVQESGGADGFVVNLLIDGGESDARYCTVAAFATTDASRTLTGTASINGVTYQEGPSITTALGTSTLSGDVFVTAPVTVDTTDYDAVTASAVGAAVKTVTTSSTTTTSTPKTAKQKATAKTAYSKKLKSAKASYKKALAKAGKSSSKKAKAKAKAKAKKAYAAKRAAAKAKYQRAISPAIATTSGTSPTISKRAFDVSTMSNFII